MVANNVGTVHGILYIIYLLVAYPLSRRLRLPVASPTVMLLLAGTIPVLTFVVERWITRRYINPAMAAEAAAPGPAAPAGSPADRAVTASIVREHYFDRRSRAPRTARAWSRSCCPTCTWSWPPTPGCSPPAGSTRAPGCCWRPRRRPRPPATCSTSAAATGRIALVLAARSPGARSGRWT